MTQAEKLAEWNQRKRRPRNLADRPPAVWVCRCREVRDGLDLTLRAVAGAVGLSVSGLHAIEHGSDLVLTTARRLADFYGRSVEWLWPGRAKGGRQWGRTPGP